MPSARGGPTMWSGDLPPDDSDLGSLLFLLCLVDVGYLLAEIEASIHVSPSP